MMLSIIKIIGKAQLSCFCKNITGALYNEDCKLFLGRPVHLRRQGQKVVVHGHDRAPQGHARRQRAKAGEGRKEE